MEESELVKSRLAAAEQSVRELERDIERRHAELVSGVASRHADVVQALAIVEGYGLRLADFGQRLGAVETMLRLAPTLSDVQRVNHRVDELDHELDDLRNDVKATEGRRQLAERLTGLILPAVIAAIVAWLALMVGLQP